MGEAAAKGAGQAGAKQQSEAPKPEPPASSQPREYVVYRELKLRDLNVEGSGIPGLDGDATVLVELGVCEAKTPKEARRTVAKAKLDEAELRTETGVPLRAITKTAATAGRGIAKLKVEPTWAD